MMNGNSQSKIEDSPIGFVVGSFYPNDFPFNHNLIGLSFVLE
jgi:hypothetical protein